ncbi:MAG TPA: DUF1707 domain-containing protein [Mycobacteriales bacterium]
MTAPEPRPLEPNAMRAGNEDREKVVAHLNSAFAEGRLDVSELEERVAAAYRAKTMGELAPLTADLPAQYAASPVRRPTPQPPARPAGERHDTARWAPIGGGLAIFLVNVLIWAAVSAGTGNLIYFWPIWTAIPLVIAVVGVVLSGGHRDGR